MQRLATLDLRVRSGEPVLSGGSWFLWSDSASLHFIPRWRCDSMFRRVERSWPLVRAASPRLAAIIWRLLPIRAAW